MSSIDFHEKQNIGVLTLNRPQALNAINKKLLEEMSEVIDSIDTNRVRCLIVTGQGNKAFAAGADVSEMLNFNKETALRFSKMGNDIFRNLEILPIPTIAAVNGYAIGGGCELALCCDIRLASDDATFMLPETRLGIIPGFGGTQRLMRHISISQAKEMIFTGVKINSKKALEIGLVNSIHPSDELMPVAFKIAEAIVRNAPFAIKNAKKAMTEGTHLNLYDAVMNEARIFGDCYGTSEPIEGIRTFLDEHTYKIF